MTPNTSRQRWNRRIGLLIVGIAVSILCGGLMANAQSKSKNLVISDFKIQTPTVAFPYYHFSARLDLPQPGSVRIQDLRANSETIRNYILLAKGESFDPDQVRNRRRMVIAKAIKSPRPERVYRRPTLVGRLDWRNSQSYKLEIALTIGDNPQNYRAEAKTAAPDKGGYWNPAWKRYQSVVVSETAGKSRVGEPVEVTLLFYPYTIHDPAKEIRVVRYDCKRKDHQEIPSQVIDSTLVQATEPPAYNERGKRRPATIVPTRSATIVFPADVKAHESNVYLVFYDNEQVSAPHYVSDLKISGTAPGVTIENRSYRLKMHDASGMLDELTLKAKPQYTFVHKKETNGAIQWNPGCYAPPRAWAHLSDWEPGKYDYQYEEVRGPLMYMTRRSGQMPSMPELECSMVYKFYANLPYYVMSSSVHVRYDVSVAALRNAEVVFAREAFNGAAWWDPIRQDIETRRITSAPDLTEWTMPDDTPWVAFFDREKGCGYAGIQTQYANGGLQGLQRTFNPYIYITVGPWIYWTRALAYPYGSRNPQQLIKVPAGSVFLEEWAYLPFELSTNKDDPFQNVEKISEILPHPLHVHVEEPIDARMEVPEEIYIEPAKTGWEKEKNK